MKSKMGVDLSMEDPNDVWRRNVGSFRLVVCIILSQSCFGSFANVWCGTVCILFSLLGDDSPPPQRASNHLSAFFVTIDCPTKISTVLIRLQL